MGRVTLEDIARMANVSKSTVSRVLNQKYDGVGVETRRRVLSVIERLEYEPSLHVRGPAVTQSKILGVVVPDISNPSVSAVVRSIENNACKNGYSILLSDTDDSVRKEEDCILNMVLRHVDGIILVSSVQEQPPLIHNRLKKYNIPCVLLNRKVHQMDYSAGIFVDNEYASFLATELLIRHGNRNIVYLSSKEEQPVSQERLEGYRISLKNHQIPYNPELVHCEKDSSVESGAAMLESLLKRDIPFTAVLADCDTMAVSAMKILKAYQKRIPWDAEVIGFDSMHVGEAADPTLSTVEQPAPELGSQVVKTILQLIEGKQPVDQNIRLDARLVIRNSTRQERKEQ